MNCARTGDYTNWCEQGDESGWNITSAERGSGPQELARNAALQSDAKDWSQYLYATEQFCHDVVDHDGIPIEFQCGFTAQPAYYAENIAITPLNSTEFTDSTARAAAKKIIDQYLNSPSHRAAILWDASFVETFDTGIEVVIEGNFAAAWSTQRFFG